MAYPNKESSAAQQRNRKQHHNNGDHSLCRSPKYCDAIRSAHDNGDHKLCWPRFCDEAVVKAAGSHKEKPTDTRYLPDSAWAVPKGRLRAAQDIRKAKTIIHWATKKPTGPGYPEDHPLVKASHGGTTGRLVEMWEARPQEFEMFKAWENDIRDFSDPDDDQTLCNPYFGDDSVFTLGAEILADQLVAWEGRRMQAYREWKKDSDFAADSEASPEAWDAWIEQGYPAFLARDRRLPAWDNIT